MRADQKPFSDVRVRQAISLAIDRQGILDATAEGVGVFNPPVPAALKEWSLPMDKLGEGAKYYKHDKAEAKRLLAAAGYPNGFPGSICFTTYGSTVLVDAAQLMIKQLKDVRCLDDDRDDHPALHGEAMHDRVGRRPVFGVRVRQHAHDECNASATVARAPGAAPLVRRRANGTVRARSGRAIGDAAATAARVDLVARRQRALAGLATVVADDDVVGPAGAGSRFLRVTGAAIPDTLAERHECSCLRGARALAILEMATPRLQCGCLRPPVRRNTGLTCRPGRRQRTFLPCSAEQVLTRRAPRPRMTHGGGDCTRFAKCGAALRASRE